MFDVFVTVVNGFATITNNTSCAITTNIGAKRKMDLLIVLLIITGELLLFLAIQTLIQIYYNKKMVEQLGNFIGGKFQTFKASLSKGLTVKVEQEETDMLTNIVQGLGLLRDIRKEGFSLDSILGKAKEIAADESEEEEEPAD